MRSKITDHQNTRFILHNGNQPIVIRLDVEYHPAALEDARLWVGQFYILRRPPLRRPRYGSPGVVLRPRRLDSLVACLALKIRLDDVGPDHDHWLRYYQSFHKMEIGVPFYGYPHGLGTPGNLQPSSVRKLNLAIGSGIS